MGVANRPTHHLVVDQVRTGRRRSPNASPAHASVPRPRQVTDRLQRLRELAGAGTLAATFAAASSAERAELTGAAYDVVWPIVYSRVTRRYEQLRGHPGCASGVANLADECLDRFHDDVESVVQDLLNHARHPVHQLEAWIGGRLVAATVDGHRRRRGERGALQRPRLPGWVADGLDHDRWLTVLAVEILTWVGVRMTAGTETWPLDAWAHHRAQVTGDWAASTPATVAREVETVLAVLRRRPTWYESYVERPLGAKQTPVAAVPAEAPLVLGDPDDRVESELLRLAAEAVRAIDARLSTGGRAEAVVADVIRTVFGGAFLATLDRAPHAAADPLGGVSDALTDLATLKRIVDTVTAIVTEHR